ncbi:MAG TPA: PfkB family carbohydrate kinase [Solirubrobacteraceae bacterium]|jgi:sugar/nucleoside kinase (ribokinase family)|nr:PfkB family carbohydrate kinase [Solirubrobacteraceae bacterium]
MSVTVVGSLAYDAVETPFGKRDRMLGGAATHFALAASFFDTVHVVGPVGDDFADEDMAILATRGTDVSDVERVAGGKTFFWAGKYSANLNERDTLDTQLNVFESFQPKLSEGSRASEVLFLANIHPDLQYEVRQQCQAAKFVAMDSMNFWIESTPESLARTIASVDCLILNDEEVEQLTGAPNLVQGARRVLAMGPSVVVAKQGKYGAALFTPREHFWIPAYPLETVADPTGAGDTFAGGFVGAIAAAIGEGHEIDASFLKQAMAYGTALASFNVEEFGTERVARLTTEEIPGRIRDLQRITRFENRPVALRA